MTWLSIFNAKCELGVKVLPIFISVHSCLPDQTPTPTRFLKNCEEVGLFNELASSFEQDDDEKRAKNSVRKAWGWWFCHLCVRVFVNDCVYYYAQKPRIFFSLQRLPWCEKLFFTSFFLTSSFDPVKNMTCRNSCLVHFVCVSSQFKQTIATAFYKDFSLNVFYCS